MSGRSLSPEENERVVAAIRELLVASNQTALAPQLGVKQPTLSSLLSGRHRGSYALARRVAALRRVPVDRLLGTEGTRVEYDAATGLDASALGRRADFAEAREDCELRYGKWLAKYPGILDRTATMGLGRTFDRLTGDVLFKLAEALIAGDEKAE